MRTISNMLHYRTRLCNSIVCVGGRLQNSSLDLELIHSIILPKTGSTFTMIARDCHNTIAHGSRSATMHEIRRAGYWIINRNTLAHSVNSWPPQGLCQWSTTHHCGVDLFGPFLVKERQSKLKIHGALFTCLVRSAVHIEAVATMETDSFIMALRRMIARRGNIRSMRSDNGTNFVGNSKGHFKMWRDTVNIDSRLNLQVS